MINFYPSHDFLKNSFLGLSGHHVGIMESQILMSAKSKFMPYSALCTSSMPAYHKKLLGENIDMSYHISGYGMFKEEALIRVLGEGIERYALLVAPTVYKDRIVYGSYNTMMELGEVIPWEYIKIFSNDDYDKLKEKTTIRPIEKDSVIGWLKCPSIFEKGREIFVPAQFLFVGYKANEEVGEKMFTPGFSKGSAAHTDFKKALKSAIQESIEADALMINWYTEEKIEKVIIDDYNLLSMASELLGESDYEIAAYNYSVDDMPGNTFGVSLINKEGNRPYIVMGCQSALNPMNAMYRGFMEALAILYLANNGALVMPEDYLDSCHKTDFLNLDGNVAYWAKNDEMDLKRSVLEKNVIKEVPLCGFKDMSLQGDDEELKMLLEKLNKVSEYGVYLDITPTEVAGKGWKVVRCFFPELVQMSFPGVPYSEHPRMKKHGGIKNDLPHPLP